MNKNKKKTNLKEIENQLGKDVWLNLLRLVKCLHKEEEE